VLPFLRRGRLDSPTTVAALAAEGWSDSVAEPAAQPCRLPLRLAAQRCSRTGKIGRDAWLS